MAAPLFVETDVLAPLVQSVAEVVATRHGRGSGVWPELLAPQEAEWRPARAFADSGSAELRGLLQRIGAHYNVPPHAAAALAWKAYSYWVTLPVVAGWSAHRRVLLADIDTAVVRLNTSAPYLTMGVTEASVAVLPDDPAAGAAGVTVVADESALLRALREYLVDRHLVPVMRALTRISRIGERALWGSVANSLAHPLVASTVSLPRDPRTEVTTVLAGVGGPVSRLVQVVPDPTTPTRLAVRRNTCCLAFTNPDLGFCSSCCVVPPTR